MKNPHNVRQWLELNKNIVSPYTIQRIFESHAFIEKLLIDCPSIKHSNAYDIGSGAGFNSFVLAENFDRVVAIDTLEEPILEARLIAKGADINNIIFEVADAETFNPSIEFDFVLCNLMSHNAISRSNLIRKISDVLVVGGCLFYAEIAEGYAPMEIHRAILHRDYIELTSRLQQIIKSFLGRQGFRFFASGTIQSVLEYSGLDLKSLQNFKWNGLVHNEYASCMKLEKRDRNHTAEDKDYIKVPADYAIARTWFQELLSNRKTTGFTTKEKLRIRELAKQSNKYAPFMLYLLMVDIVLRSAPRALLSLLPGSFTKPEEKGFALLSKLKIGLTATSWGQLTDIDSEITSLARQRAGLEGDSSDD